MKWPRTSTTTTHCCKGLMLTTGAFHPLLSLLRVGIAHRSATPSRQLMRSLIGNHIMAHHISVLSVAQTLCAPQRMLTTTRPTNPLLHNIHPLLARCQLVPTPHTLGQSRLVDLLPPRSVLPPGTLTLKHGSLIPALMIVITQPLLGIQQHQGTQTLHNHPSPHQEPRGWSQIVTPVDEARTLKVANPPALAQDGPLLIWYFALPATHQGWRVTTLRASPDNRFILL